MQNEETKPEPRNLGCYERTISLTTARRAGLRFGLDWLLSLHADLRVSLREVRERQRASGSLKRLDRDPVPALRFDQALQEILRVRVGDGRQRQRRCARVFKRWRRLLRRPLRRPRALITNRFPSRSLASSPAPPSRAIAVSTLRASRHPWPPPALSRRCVSRNARHAACRRRPAPGGRATAR